MLYGTTGIELSCGRACVELLQSFWLAILELTVTADYRNAPFSSIREGRGGENSGTAHEIEETGFEEGEMGKKGSENSGKEGE